MLLVRPPYCCAGLALNPNQADVKSFPQWAQQFIPKVLHRPALNYINWSANYVATERSITHVYTSLEQHIRPELFRNY